MPGSSGTTVVRRISVKGWALALVLLAGTACGSDQDGRSSAKPPAEAAAGSDSLVSMMRRLGEGLDYETHISPGKLGEAATLTVVGTVEAVDDGRVFGVGPTRDAEPVFLNVTLAVRVESVLAGNGSLVRDGLVHVEIARTKATPVAAFERAVRTSQRLVLFLDDYTRGPGTFPLIEKAPSIPDGATVFAPYADGFLVEDDDSRELIGGYDPLDELPPTWREGTASVKSFKARHFPGK